MEKLTKDWKDKRIPFNPTIRQIFVLHKCYELMTARMKLEFLDRKDLGRYIIKKLDKYIKPEQWKELNNEWKELRIEWMKKHHSKRIREVVSKDKVSREGNVRSWSSE